MSDGYEILTLDEVETADHRGSNLIPVRHTLGYRAAGVNAWIADSGGQLIPPHDEEDDDEELYVVVRGRAAFTVGEETADAPAGTLVFVPPNTFRTASAEEDGTIVVVVGATAGKPFESGGWEAFVIAMTFQRAGRLGDAREAVEQLIASAPDHWGVYYNAACFEALTGNPDAAFAHLRRAKELGPEETARYLPEDGDLDSLRDDPRYRELLA